MTNHVHLIMELGEKASDISKLMKKLSGRQAAYVNKLERRTGALWEGRFKASPIQKDEYMLPCVRYIEMNPVKAGMVMLPEKYLWSSYLERAGLSDRGLITLDESYLTLSDTNDKRLVRYKEYLAHKVSDSEYQLLRESVRRNQLTGNNCFIDEIESRIGFRVETRGRGRPAKVK